MEDPTRLRECGVEAQNAIDTYVRKNDIASYKQLQTSLAHLRIAASKPADILYRFRIQVLENVSIVMLLEMGVLQTLVARERTPTTSAFLAAATGYNELVITRLMRIASALLFCEETDETTYRANDITLLLVKPGWVGAFEWAETVYPAVADIRSFVSSTDYARTGSPSAPPAFDFSHGKSMWKLLEEQPHQRRNFDTFMRERRVLEERSWHKRFPPCASLGSGTDLKIDQEAVLMVDIGGANGSQILDFKAQFPNLPGRYVLQDLSFLTSPAATETKPVGVEVMGYDFFTPQPIKGARYYYFRNVFHNWPDEKCAEILRNLVPAMDPDYSTLLIDDYVLPPKGTQLLGAMEDILMMVYLNALERTSRQYEDLLRGEGLEIVNIFAVGVNEEAVIEARIRKS